MTRLAHISDLHFGTEEIPVCTALRDNLLQEAPDLVVLTGDITQRARPGQFRAARDFLDSLAPLPVLALPGNHDLPLFDLLSRFARPYGGYRRYVSDTLAPIWRGGEAVVVGVNSTRVLRHKNGVLSAALVEEVTEKLSRVSGTFKVVALHHPLAVVEARDLTNRARGAEDALAAWIAAGADLFLGGHIHLSYCIQVWGGSRQAVVLQAGTAVSTRRRSGRPNSYNLIRLETASSRRMILEERDYDGRTGQFAVRVTWEAKSPAGSWTSLQNLAPVAAALSGN